MFICRGVHTAVYIDETETKHCDLISFINLNTIRGANTGLHQLDKCYRKRKRNINPSEFTFFE